jgi:threonine dehydrogenase-like Zn-dependent dehydrogenase
MKALLYSDWGKIEVTDVPMPVPAEGEVLLRVEACGICGSEVECVLQRHPRRVPPLILGHEFSGTVEALGSGVTDLKPGDAVVANSVVHCGTCLPCQREETNLCVNRSLFGMHRPGGAAEFVAVPASVLFPRPAHMTAQAGALIEPASNGVHVMNLLPNLDKKTLFVFGAGFIGLSVLQAAKAMCGSKVAVADLIPQRLECARALGADAVFNSAEVDVVQEAIAFSGQDGMDYVVDAVGAAVTKTASINMTRPGGGVCWLGLREDPISFPSFSITNPQRTVIGSYAATSPEFEETLGLMSDKRMDLEQTVTTCGLSKAAEEFHRTADAASAIIKMLILPQE